MLIEKSPNKRLLNGVMLCSTLFLYSVSAIQRPAKNAPIASDKPSLSVAAEALSTSRKVVGTYISSFCVEETMLKRGRKNILPIIVIPTTTANAFKQAIPSACTMLECGCDIRGNTANKGTTARSCINKVAKDILPT